MAYLQETDVQAWLEQTKLTVPAIEPPLEEMLASRVLGAISARYDTTAWVDRTTTPALVRSALAMFYAAAIYRRQYSENLESTGAYPDWLESTAQMLLNQIVQGIVDIPGSDDPDTDLSEPVFYPTDAASDPDFGDDPIKFTMSVVF